MVTITKRYYLVLSHSVRARLTAQHSQKNRHICPYTNRAPLYIISHISTVPRHKSTYRKCKTPFQSTWYLRKMFYGPCQSQYFFLWQHLCFLNEFFPDLLWKPGQTATGPTVPAMQDTSLTLWRRFNHVRNGRTLLSWDPISLGTGVSTNRLRENFFIRHCYFLKQQQQLLHIVTAFRTKLSARLDS